MRALLPALLLVLTGPLASSTRASAAPAPSLTGPCTALCCAPCLKPIAIPDRWDDTTAVAGYTGGGKRSPDWRGNGQFDRESFDDEDEDGIRDETERFIDQNRNGSYDEELYDPVRTGYMASPGGSHRLAPGGDHGRRLSLCVGTPSSVASPVRFVTIALPSVNRGQPNGRREDFIRNWRTCEGSPIAPGEVVQLTAGRMTDPLHAEMIRLVDQDPDAAWDSTSSSIAGSSAPVSPRVILFVAYDPRIGITSGHGQVEVRKVLAFFAERSEGPAELSGRLVRLHATDEAAARPADGGFVRSCGPGTKAAVHR